MIISGSLSFKKSPVQGSEKSLAAQTVVFNLVQNIPLCDYSQAQKTWDALLEAGIEPGELVVKGLHNGHQYPIAKSSVKANGFKNPDLVSDYQSSSSQLIGYTKTKPQLRDFLPSETTKNDQNSSSQSVETYLTKSTKQIRLTSIL